MFPSGSLVNCGIESSLSAPDLTPFINHCTTWKQPTSESRIAAD